MADHSTQAAIARFEADIANLKEGMRWFESRKADLETVSTGGKGDQLSDIMIEHYGRTIADLEKVVADLEAE